MPIRITNLLSQSHPVAAHCPGPLSNHWHRFVDAVLAQPARKCACPEATILTWNSGETGKRPDKPCGVFERSLERLGIQPRVLGRGRANWRNLDKFALTADALDQIQTPFVIGGDSCDIVFFDDPQLVVDRFRQHFTCDLLFNATGSACWPPLPEFVNFQSSLPMASVMQGRHWINSGLFIGRTEFCRDYFRKLATEPAVMPYSESDQGVVMKTWPDWYPRVQIDYLSQVFQWFNEDRVVMRLERSAAARQTQLLKWLGRISGPITGAEVGVFDGYTSEVLLRERPDLKLWMVDSWKPYADASSLSQLDAAAFDRALATATWWTDFAMNRRFLLREASPRAADRFANDSLDFAFLDGSHLYEAVCADLFAWWPKVRTGGLLTGHDYGVYQDAKGAWGVRRAVDEFAERNHRPITLGADGTWCIEK